MATHHHVLQNMRTAPRQNSLFDARIPKASDGMQPTTVGDDSKLYKLSDKRDMHRFHILSDAQLEDEKRRAEDIKAALLTRRAPAPSSSSSSSSSRNNSARPSPAPSPSRPRSAPAPGRVTASSVSAATPGIAEDVPVEEVKATDAPDAADPLSATGIITSLRSQYEENLDVIDQLYRDKRSLEGRVRSLEFQLAHPNSRSMIPGSEDLRRSAKVAAAVATATHAAAKAVPKGGKTGAGTGGATSGGRAVSPMATVVDALTMKNMQNQDVIDRLTAERKALEGRARSLERQLTDGGAGSSGSTAASTSQPKPRPRPQSARPAARRAGGSSSGGAATTAGPGGKPPTGLRSMSVDLGKPGADPENAHWELHLDPVTDELYYYNTATGECQPHNTATRPASADRARVFEISPHLQVDVMRYKQRVAEAKGREDAAHEAELKHRQEQDARLKRATELPADGAAFAGMREREEEAARRRKQRLDKAHAEAEQQRQKKEEQERAEKERHQALLAKIEAGEKLTWQEMEERKKHARAARVTSRVEELKAASTGFVPAKGSEGRHRQRTMEKFYPQFYGDASDPRAKGGLDDPEKVVVALERQKKAWEEMLEKKKEKRAHDEQVRRETEATRAVATTKKVQGKVFHGTETMVNRAIQAEHKRLEKERGQRMQAREAIEKKLEHDREVRERLLNSKTPDHGRRGPNARAQLFQVRRSSEQLQEELRKREADKAKAEREHYLALMNKAANGVHLTWQERRNVLLFDKKQQEEAERAKKEHALALKRLAEKQHGAMLRAIIADREADRKLGDGYVELSAVVQKAAELAHEKRADEQRRRQNLKKGINDKLSARPSLILRHDAGPDGYRYCACAKCKKAYEKAKAAAAASSGAGSDGDDGDDDFGEKAIQKATSAHKPAAPALDEDDVFDVHQQVDVKDTYVEPAAAAAAASVSAPSFARAPAVGEEAAAADASTKGGSDADAPAAEAAAVDAAEAPAAENGGDVTRGEDDYNEESFEKDES